MKQKNALNLKTIINGSILNVNTLRSQIEKGGKSPLTSILSPKGRGTNLTPSLRWGEGRGEG
jgi:hypothetical protein